MYSHFKGTIEEVYEDRIDLDVNDVGYEIYMPESEILTIRENKGKIKVYTYLNVREDDMKLFGFLSKSNLEFFKKLIGVSGVGPKVALGIISNISPSQMCVAIATENIITLKAIPGIGPKMAQKIIFELKDKVKKEEIEKSTQIFESNIVKNESVEEAITALEVLGYRKVEIKDILSKLNLTGKKVEDIIKLALKEMQK